MNPLADSPAPSFDDPLGMLRVCHDRIGRQLATLERLTRHLPEQGADAGAQGAARAILSYFDSAAANHHADEEASVFPRLIARAPSARNLIVRLEREHARLAATWRRLRPLIAGIATGRRSNLPPALVRGFGEAYDAHLAAENATLLPWCADVLTADELDAIGAEMAARRGARPARGRVSALS